MDNLTKEIEEVVKNINIDKMVDSIVPDPEGWNTKEAIEDVKNTEKEGKIMLL